jgi:hypothetical protein
MTAERHIKRYLAATRRPNDPHRTLRTASTPYVVACSVGSADRAAIVAGTIAAERSDADYIHLEFEPGSECDGPVNVVIGMVRFGICHVRESCRFWQGRERGMELVATCGVKAATMMFDPNGADSRAGLPGGDYASIRLSKGAMRRGMKNVLTAARSRSWIGYPARSVCHAVEPCPRTLLERETACRVPSDGTKT